MNPVKVTGNNVIDAKVASDSMVSSINLSKIEEGRAASFQTLKNKELGNTLNTQTKGDKSRISGDHVKT